MMTTSTSTVRTRQTWPIFSYGFRPFFLFGALEAAFAVAIWVPWFLGFFAPPTALPALSWHAHSLLFGFVPAIMAGFLLTAIPNWTGRRPISGWPLAALFTLWLAGRVLVMLSAHVSPWIVALIDLSFPVALTAVAAREIAAVGNWRNLKVVLLLAILVGDLALFHWEIDRYGKPELSIRLALGTTLAMIMLIGGRIVPNFTSSWIRRTEPGFAPKLSNAFDALAMSVGIAAFAVWIADLRLVLAPGLCGGFLVIAGLLHFARQARWWPHRTTGEPLVLILHVAYAFVPLGFLLSGIAVLSEESIPSSAGIHAWTTGAVGTMTLAVMTRASLGHTGRPLKANPATVAIYIAIVLAALLRVAGVLLPERTLLLIPAAGVTWIAAFVGFAFAYGPMLMKRRVDSPSRPPLT